MTRPPRTAWDETKEELLPFLRRLIVSVIVIGLALLTWQLKDVLLLAFAAVLVAIVLLAAARLVHGVTGLGHRWSVALGGILSFVILAGALWLAAPSIGVQVPILLERLTASLTELEGTFGFQLPESVQEIAQSFSGFVDQIWSGVVNVASALIGTLTTLLLVVFAGAFIALDPTTYREGLVLLFPKTWHFKIRQVLEKTGHGLHLWLRAQILAMLLVGLLTGLGVWLIGLPSPLALGLIAGLTEFIPILGPILGSVPAILVSLTVDDGSAVVWTIALYVVVQQLEGNLLTPVLQRRIVSIPPVVLLFSFVALGVLFGVAGVVVAAPMTIAVYILVREFYVGDLLEEREALGEPIFDDIAAADEAAAVKPKAPARRTRTRSPARRKSAKDQS